MAATLSLLRFAPLPPRLARSSLAINLSPFPNRSIRIRPRPRVPPISASYTVSYVDRAISMLSYVLPFLKSLPYGLHLQLRYPIVASLTSPFVPMLKVYNRAPSPGFLGFLVLYIFLARNPAMSRYVRFNAMQAMLLDVMLVLPLLVQRMIVRTQSSQIGSKALQFGNGVIFVLGFATFVYSVLCCLVGRTPYLPLVSSAADKQL